MKREACVGLGSDEGSGPPEIFLPKRRRWRGAGRAVVTVAILLLALVGCGSGASSSGGEGEPVTLKVGVLPIAPVAPLYLGIDKGFFEEEGLAIEPQATSAGASNLTSVVSGDVQVGFSDVVSQLVAASEGLPIQILVNANSGGTDPSNTYSAVVVKGDGPIERPEDLAGKTIAVNALNNIGDVTIKGALEDRGVDVSTLEFIEVPYPAMVGALEDDRVDAIWVVEPFLTQAKAATGRPVLYNYVEGIPEGTLATYFTSRPYVGENPEAVDRFVRAMNKSQDYAEEHPDEVRAIIPTYTEIPDPVAEKMILPIYGSELRTGSVEAIGDLLQKYEVIESKPDLNALIYKAREG